MKEQKQSLRRLMFAMKGIAVIKSHQLLICLAGIFILSACVAKPEMLQPEEIGALPTPSEVVEEMLVSPDFVVQGHEQARDVAVAYVAERAGLPLPVGEWVFQDQTAQGSADASTWLFTNGPWVVQVSAPAIAPQQIVYSITVDHLSAIIRWEGTVDSFGEIVEQNFMRGSQPESPEKPEEPSWVGVVVSNPPGSQFDDYFQTMDQNGTRYGITGADEALEEQLISYRDTGVVVQVWGILQKDVPDAYEVQILVTRIKPY
jgi:hypothetical protein